MGRIVWTVLVGAALGAPASAQQANEQQGKQQGKTSDASVESRLEALQKEVAELRRATGNGSERSPDHVSRGYLDARASGLGLPQEGVTTRENERLRIGGRLDFEFYDINANRKNLGVYGGNQFGLNGGASEFRVRRLQLGLDMEMIEDFVFHSTLTFDPVVRDQDEGAVDIDEAYARFSNIVRNLFGFEDPTNAWIQAGNYYRWEREFLNRWSESFSLAGTSFYLDEVTGLAAGGDFEMGLFWRVSVDNGSLLGARDAGVGAGRGGGGSAVGNSPIFHDNEQLGDVNNNKDFSLGVGFSNEVEEPKVQYGIAASYRHGRLSAAERALLAATSPAYDGTGQKQRFGLLFTIAWALEQVTLGGDAELWFASDGNGERRTVSLAPHVKIPLDGVYYQKRLFFTGVGAGYRWSNLHLTDGFSNAAPGNPQSSILDDRTMHTVAAWLEVTRNVDLRLELNNVDPNNGQRGTETEWLVQWSVRF